MFKFKQYLGEATFNERAKDLSVVVLTNVSSNKPTIVPNMIKDECIQLNVPCHSVITSKAWISKNNSNTGMMTISNFDGRDNVLEINPKNTVCIVRAGAISNNIGLELVSTIESAGAFMINNAKAMQICDNKMSTYVQFKRDNVPTPKTALVSNEKALADAHKRIGGKFPVIIKTITGTQGIGVSIVHDMQSMTSVMQSLWKYNAELLIQEALTFDYDVRTIVVNGKILASTKRVKAAGDFRSNRHRGATTEPHKLTKPERIAIKRAARSVNGYIVGVDHAISNGKVYVLEVNGSPGIGSDFGMYDLNDLSEGGKYLGPAEPKTIVKNLVKHFTDKQNLKHQFQIEAGYLETVDIVGIGPIKAKFDTGNGTHASMFHVDKLDVQNNMVHWIKNGKGFSHRLEGMSNPSHVGMKDPRPIVKVDIEFNGKLYKGVPLGLTTKESNSEMLINRDLLTKFRVYVNPNRKFVLSHQLDDIDDTDE